MLFPIHMRSVALLFGSVALASGQNGAQAIFENQCVSCHGTAPMSGLDLRQRDTILKGGKRGPLSSPAIMMPAWIQMALSRCLNPAFESANGKSYTATRSCLPAKWSWAITIRVLYGTALAHLASCFVRIG